MAVEQAFLALLPTLTTAAVDGETLTLSDASGQPILVFDYISGEQAIAGDWTVTAVRTANAVSSPVPGSELTLSFASGTTSGYAGCNQFTGGYKLTGDDLTIGPLASTRRACVDPAAHPVEVTASHLGLAFDPRVIDVVSDSLLRTSSASAVEVDRGKSA